MRLFSGFIATIALVACTPGHGQGVAQEFEITKSYETANESSDGSSGSSNGSNVLVERLVAVRDNGLELEYDLPSAEDRARQWQFPARIFRPTSGPVQLLNRADLEKRLDEWLKAGKMARDACGKWIFTWNAFQIECDPQSVLKAIEAIDLRSVVLRDGAEFQDKYALEPGLMRAKAAPSGAYQFEVLLKLNPAAIRQDRAQAKVIVGEISRKTITLDQALNTHAQDSISGTVTVTFDTDSNGSAWRRTRVTRIETKKPDGVVETSTETQVVTRQPVQ